MDYYDPWSITHVSTKDGIKPIWSLPKDQSMQIQAEMFGAGTAGHFFDGNAIIPRKDVVGCMLGMRHRYPAGRISEGVSVNPPTSGSPSAYDVSETGAPVASSSDVYGPVPQTGGFLPSVETTSSPNDSPSVLVSAGLYMNPTAPGGPSGSHVSETGATIASSPRVYGPMRQTGGVLSPVATTSFTSDTSISVSIPIPGSDPSEGSNGVTVNTNNNHSCDAGLGHLLILCTIIGAAAAIVTLLITFAQTFYAIYGYYRPPGKT